MASNDDGISVQMQDGKAIIEINVDDLDSKLETLSKLSLRIAQDKTAAIVAAERSGQNTDATYARIAAEYDPKEKRVKEEGIRISLEKTLVDCILQAMPIWAKNPGSSSADEILRAYRAEYIKNIRKMAFELSGPTMKWIYAETEQEGELGQRETKEISEKHTKEWQEICMQLRPLREKVGISDDPIVNNPAFAQALQESLSSDHADDHG